jgi:hypothetical protein
MAWNIATSSPNRTLAAMAGRRRGEWEGEGRRVKPLTRVLFAKLRRFSFVFFFLRSFWKNEQLPSAVSSDLDRSLPTFFLSISTVTSNFGAVKTLCSVLYSCSRVRPYSPPTEALNVEL